MLQTDLAQQFTLEYHLGRNGQSARAVQLAMAQQCVGSGVFKDTAIMCKEETVFYGNRPAGGEFPD